MRLTECLKKRQTAVKMFAQSDKYLHELYHTDCELGWELEASYLSLVCVKPQFLDVVNYMTLRKKCSGFDWPKYFAVCRIK